MTEKHIAEDLFGVNAGAVFEGQYRYDLFRIWDRHLPMILFVMLNPSIADEKKLDPTVTRCRNFAVSWGFGSLHVVNMFALISTDPKKLFEVEDPVGPKNDYYIQKRAEQAGKIIVAWGAHYKVRSREKRVLDILKKQGEVYCLGLTQERHPRHPLYVADKVTPVVFSEELKILCAK